MAHNRHLNSWLADPDIDTKDIKDEEGKYYY